MKIKIMKLKYFIITVLISNLVVAQTAFHNYGNLKMHETAQVGFHLNLINDGSFDENKGLVGFYSNGSSTISGVFSPIFNDMEIIVGNNLFLDIGLSITNNVNFIVGNINTPKNSLDINLEFTENAFYTGETDQTKVNGYVSIRNKQNFKFPIGHENRSRPLELLSNTNNANAKSAYFFEDPNTPSYFNTSFNTTARTDILLSVSTYEYWDVDSAVLSKISIDWDTNSNLPNFINDIANLRVVGWNTENKIWEDLGRTEFLGDFTSGSITSDVFMPNNYSVITFGGSLDKDNFTLDDFWLSPNGDGVNDYLVINEVALSPNNRLQIFNRWGRIVYDEKNYKNLFEGTSNSSLAISKNKKVPNGAYFYIITLNDINVTHQGFLYISKF